MYAVVAVSPDGSRIRIEYPTFTDAHLCRERLGRRGWTVADPIAVTRRDVFLDGPAIRRVKGAAA